MPVRATPTPGKLAPGGSERALWVAVVHRALHDALGGADRRDREHARDWLSGTTSDLREVCDLADIDVGFLHKRIAGLQARGWRPPRGGTRRRGIVREG